MTAAGLLLGLAVLIALIVYLGRPIKTMGEFLADQEVRRRARGLSPLSTSAKK